ncbi:8731_t:CDS:2, partial [Ambispora gerdemannii]
VSVQLSDRISEIQDYRWVIGSKEYTIQEAFALLDKRLDQEEHEERRCLLYDYINGEYQLSAYESRVFQESIYMYNQTKKSIEADDVISPFSNWLTSFQVSSLDNLLRVVRTQEDELFMEWKIAYRYKGDYRRYTFLVDKWRMISRRNEMLATEIQELYDLLSEPPAGDNFELNPSASSSIGSTSLWYPKMGRALSSTNTASITPTFKKNSKKTRRLNDFFTLTKLVFTTVPFLLSLFSTVQASTTENILHKRYSANALCPLLGVGEKYCKPTVNQTFTSLDWILFAWNTLASPFPVEGALDIYLRRTQGTKIVESRQHVSNNLGQLSFQPQSYWFEPYDPQANNTFEFFFVATPLNQNPDDLTDSGPKFYITQLPPSTQSPSAAIVTVSAPTITTTASLGLDNGSQFDSSKHSSVTTPIIVIIVVAGFLLLVAIAGLAFVILTRSRNKKKRPQSISNISTSSNIPIMVQTNFLDKDKHKSGEPESPIEASSIYSTTPLATKNSMSSLSQKLAGGIESNLLQHQQSPAFDAAMISDAYRQTLLASNQIDVVVMSTQHQHFYPGEALKSSRDMNASIKKREALLHVYQILRPMDIQGSKSINPPIEVHKAQPVKGNLDRSSDTENF